MNAGKKIPFLTQVKDVFFKKGYFLEKRVDKVPLQAPPRVDRNLHHQTPSEKEMP